MLSTRFPTKFQRKKEVNILKSHKGITGGITKRCDHSTHSLTPREERAFEVISKIKNRKQWLKSRKGVRSPEEVQNH